MYTGLRGTVHIKEMYIKNMERVINGETWLGAFGETIESPILRYANMDRSEFIPRGAVCYMPDDWKDYDLSFDTSNGLLTFTCSLKNYNDEIGYFLHMLRVIADFWNLEELYEESDVVTTHICKLGVSE